MAENPYAFPMPGIEYEDGDPHSRSHKHPGMKLRDYFAGQALIGILGNSQRIGPEVCRSAYAYADAMLAERAKPRAAEQDGGR